LKTAPNKKAPQAAGLFSGVLTTTSFSSSPFSLLELFSLLPFSYFTSDPCSLFTTIAHLLRVSSLFKIIFKACHTKIQNKNQGGARFLFIRESGIM